MVWTPDINISGTAIAGSVLGTVAVLMTLGVAGVLAGFGLFILSMLASNAVGVVGSALLFSTSVTILVSCYLWLTA